MRERKTGQMDHAAVGRAFTLVELMVVIVVIALLIGMLVPAVGTVRKQARVVASQTLLGTLTTGLETFKADGMLGGQYPQSWSDHKAGNNLDGQVRNPYKNLPGGGVSGDYIPMSGAGLLAWALVGADQLGSPGFKVFRTSGSQANTQQQWSIDTDDTNVQNDPTQSGAYALRTDNQLPVHTRVGPFVDTSKVRMSQWNRNGKFEIAAELEANPQSTDANAYPRRYPMFLDSFGFPILYWRADAAGSGLVDENRPRSGGPQLPIARGIYHWEDNGMLVDSSGATNADKLVLRPGATTHKLDWDPRQPSYTPKQLPEVGWFNRYVMDEGVQAKLAPQRADSYLLVSPGPDGVYGTADDITNFKPSAR